MANKRMYLSESYKKDLIQEVGTSYNDFMDRIDCVQGNGVTLLSISKLLGLSRQSIYELIYNSKRKNSKFFKHFAMITIFNRLWNDAPKKNKRKSIKKQKHKNASVYRPETDKEVSYE